MLKKIVLTTFILLIVFCNTSIAQEEDPMLAKAGEYVFRQSDFNRLISFSPKYFKEQVQKAPQQKLIIIKKLMEHKIISDLARKKGLDKDEDVKEQLKYLVNDLLAREYLIKYVIKDVEVTEDDLRQYYKENQKKFSIPEEVRARHILIRVPFGASDDVKSKAKEKAEGVLEWLKKGEKFETLAEQYSEDPKSKNIGGDLDYFSRGQMAKSFDEAVFSMKPGQISEVVKTDFGYHIIMLEDHKDTRTRSFKEVKDFIEKQLNDELARSKVNGFIKKATEDAGMEIYSDRILGKIKNE
jgi:peptidyl-prolyl cis-trans isomerase C